MLPISALQRQDEANRMPEATFEYPSKPLTLLRVIEFVVFGIDINRQLPFLHDICQRIFVCADDVFGINRQRSRKFFCKSLRFRWAETVIAVGIGYPSRVVPKRQSIGAPVTAECPA